MHLSLLKDKKLCCIFSLHNQNHKCDATIQLAFSVVLNKNGNDKNNRNNKYHVRYTGIPYHKLTSGRTFL